MTEEKLGAMWLCTIILQIQNDEEKHDAMWYVQ